MNNPSAPIEISTPTRLPGRMLLALVVALGLIVAACGDDDADTAATPSTTVAPDDDMADDDMADDDMAADDPAMVAVWAELVAAGLTDDQAGCVSDAVVAEWGADSVSAAGRISDEDLLRLRDIVFDCA